MYERFIRRADVQRVHYGFFFLNKRIDVPVGKRSIALMRAQGTKHSTSAGYIS